MLKLGDLRARQLTACRLIRFNRQKALRGDKVHAVFPFILAHLAHIIWTYRIPSICTMLRHSKAFSRKNKQGIHLNGLEEMSSFLNRYLRPTLYASEI